MTGRSHRGCPLPNCRTLAASQGEPEERFFPGGWLRLRPSVLPGQVCLIVSRHGFDATPAVDREQERRGRASRCRKLTPRDHACHSGRAEERRRCPRRVASAGPILVRGPLAMSRSPSRVVLKARKRRDVPITDIATVEPPNTYQIGAVSRQAAKCRCRNLLRFRQGGYHAVRSENASPAWPGTDRCNTCRLLVRGAHGGQRQRHLQSDAVGAP